MSSPPRAEPPPEVTSPGEGAAPSDGAGDALERLLALLLESSFLLTDPHGSVTKWNLQAERLFGLPAERAVGRCLFDSLIETADGSPEGVWRDFLDGGEGIDPQARLNGRGRHAHGDEFALELTFVPVRLSEGFEFSAFLQDLGVGMPAAAKLARMRRVHDRVLASIGAALADPAGHCEGARLAGALVAFRPLEELPWLEEAAEVAPAPPAAASATVGAGSLDEMLDRLAHAEREAEEAHREAGEALAERDAARTSAADARERIETLEREARELRTGVEAAVAEAGRTAEGLEQARGVAEDTRESAAAALDRLAELESGQAALATAFEELRPALSEADERAQAAAGEAAAARAEVSDANERLVQLAARVDETVAGEADRDGERTALLARLDAVERQAEEAAEARRELEAARHEIDHARIEEGASALTAFGVLEEAQQQADERRRQFEQLQHEAQESREALERLAGDARAELEQAARAREEAAEVRDLLASLQREASEALGRAEEGRSGAKQAGGEIRAARSHMEDLRELAAQALRELQEARAETEQARLAADAARARAEEARAEAELATRTAYTALEDANAAREGYRSADPSRLTAAAKAGHVELPPTLHPRPLEPPQRPLREGFDDASLPLATIGLDGHFSELNARFSELVGYSESDFRQTIWPSVVDHDQLERHRELMDEMCAGRLDSAPWETSYVHEQGLLVHMVGRLTLRRDEDGEPSDFLFAVDGEGAD